MKKLLNANAYMKDLIFLFFISTFILTIIIVMTGNGFIYGSKIDWVSQHSVLPDYFRQTFYNTGSLFPELALSLGGGQNAYNFAYYGYLNPIVLISYLFPWVEMQVYIMVSSVVVVLVSIILFFYWLKSQKAMRPMVIYVATVLFAAATPLMYHSHKQIMYMDYMPFLILALMGVDKLFAKRKKILLAVSIALMFLTSYFFAVSGMFVIGIYAIYKYILLYKSSGGESPALDVNKPFRFFAGRFIYCCIAGVMMACVILVPALYAILAGRSEAAKSISLASLLKPHFPISTLVYSPYGIGTIGIALLAIISFIIMEKNASRIFLGVTMLFITSFPLASYILNGTLYARSKSLIPFLPIVMLMVGLFLESVFVKRYSLSRLLICYPIIYILLTMQFFEKGSVKYVLFLMGDLIVCAIFLWLSEKFNKHLFIYAPLVLMAIVICVITNFSDTLIKLSDAEKYYSLEKEDLIDSVLSEDESFYRTTDICDTKYTNNKIFCKRYFSNCCYSSVYNRHYIKFCNYDLSLNNPTVNDISITSSNDVFFNTLMGVKYISSNSTAPAGYSLVRESGGYKMYSTDNSYSLGFATSNVMGIDEYLSLDPADRQLALLEYVVDDTSRIPRYSSKLEKVDIDTSMGLDKNRDGFYHINTMENPFHYVLSVPDNLKDYVYVVKCNIKEYSKKRATIRINGVQNSLSGLDASYPNKNFDFKFVLSCDSDLNELDIYIPRGCNFDFSGFEIYKIKFSEVQDLKSHVTMMTNVEYSGNNVITGKISLDTDSLFTTTIPYDEGFTVYVDGAKTAYKKTDNAFIGFDLPAGSHDIKLVYHAPFALFGKIISILGIILCLLWRDKSLKARPQQV